MAECEVRPSVSETWFPVDLRSSPICPASTMLRPRFRIEKLVQRRLHGSLIELSGLPSKRLSFMS